MPAINLIKLINLQNVLTPLSIVYIGIFYLNLDYLREYAQVCLHAQRVLEVGLREFRCERQVNLGFSFAGGYVFGPIT